MEVDREGKSFPIRRDADAWTLLDVALHSAPQSRVPVWIMRQAGRYLPEYHEVRNEAGGFFTMCQTPSMASEVTLQPLRRFPLDAAIIFCDILVVPQALGMTVNMVPGVGPVFPEPLKDPECLSRLLQASEIDVGSSLGYALNAISRTRHALEGKAPLIGFVGAPWTLMAYMVEGKGSKTFSLAKKWLYRYPKAAHELLQRVTDVLVIFLLEQVKAGAQILQVFDSWAGELSPECFRTYSLPYLQQIEKRVREGLAATSAKPVPLVLFAKGAHYNMEDIVSKTSFDVLGLDWQTDVSSVVALCRKHQRSVCLQGNLDPCALYADQDTLKQLTASMLATFQDAIRSSASGDDNAPVITHICNLGHGLHPTHDPENVKTFIEAVHTFSRTNMMH